MNNGKAMPKVEQMFFVRRIDYAKTFQMCYTKACEAYKNDLAAINLVRGTPGLNRVRLTNIDVGLLYGPIRIVKGRSSDYKSRQ